MVAPTQQPKPGTVSDLVNALLDRSYNQTVEPVLNAVGRQMNSGLIAQRLAEFEAEARRLSAAGQPLTADNPILRALTADLETELRASQRLIDTAAGPIQSTAIDAAGTLQRQLALPGVTDAQLARLGVAWNVPNPDAVAQLVQYAQSDAWAATLQKYGDDILGIVNNQAIRGIVSGWGPLRIAETLTQTVQNLPQYQANNLIRTLQLTSYRDATAMHQQANLPIAQQIVRIAALDTRTCLTCVALHGTVLWDSDRDATAPVPRVDDHFSGRCSSVVIVKGRPRNIQTGEDWFNSLPPDRQRQQASFARSPGKWDAFQSGKLTLRDFVQPYQDPTFGPMLRESSLSGALQRAGYISLPNASTTRDFASVLRDAENSIRNLPDEHLIAWSQDGSELFRVQGTSNQVTIPPEWNSRLRDAIVTHNHPDVGSSFSDVDVITAHRLNIGEIRAVGLTSKNLPLDHIIRPPAAGWGSINIDDFTARHDQRLEEVIQEYRARIAAGTTTEDGAIRQISHRVMQDLSQEFGFYYSREYGEKWK